MANLAVRRHPLCSPEVRFDGLSSTQQAWQAVSGLGRPQSLFALESETVSSLKSWESTGKDAIVNSNQPNTVTCDGRKITTCGMQEWY